MCAEKSTDEATKPLELPGTSEELLPPSSAVAAQSKEPAARNMEEDEYLKDDAQKQESTPTASSAALADKPTEQYGSAEQVTDEKLVLKPVVVSIGKSVCLSENLKSMVTNGAQQSVLTVSSPTTSVEQNQNLAENRESNNKRASTIAMGENVKVVRLDVLEEKQSIKASISSSDKLVEQNRKELKSESNDLANGSLTKEDDDNGPKDLHTEEKENEQHTLATTAVLQDEPQVEDKISKIQRIIRPIVSSTMENILNGKIYNEELADLWVNQIVNEINQRIVAHPEVVRYKHVVQVMLSKEVDNQRRYVAKSFMDSECDTAITDVYSNKNLYCACVVYALYHY